MVIGVAKERAADERRVALVPDVVRKLIASGHEVVVEKGAGTAALVPDALFTGAGAKLGDPFKADVVVKIGLPAKAEIAKLKKGSAYIGFLAPRSEPELAAALAKRGVTAFAMEAIPRISRAQSMDALSSQANVGGYKAALLGAEHSTRFYPMLMTAAGTIPPAKVLVLGVGVAGLQALATARRLGAQTTGYDVRPEVAEQVQSLGAEVARSRHRGRRRGRLRARADSEAEQAQQQQALTDAIKGFDVVITTALVPGRPAPKLVTAEAVEGMKAGSVIVDLAGEGGGNCALSKPGETIVAHDVTIAAPLNLPATMPEHASQLYARNVQALIELLADDKGVFAPDFADEVVAGACVTQEAPKK